MKTPLSLQHLARKRSRKNAARDVKRNFLKEIRDSQIIPDMYEFPLKVQKPDGVGSTTIKHFMLLPHEWVGHLYLKQRDLFHAYFLGESGDLTRYWQHEIHMEWAMEHPLLQGMAHEDPALIGAFGSNLHGDAARFINKGKLLVISITGSLCKVCGLAGRLVVTVVPDFLIIPGIAP